MGLGSSLSSARRKSGLSQEAVAEKLGVSRQTISKWGTDETLPDIRQCKKLSALYHVTLDELVEFDSQVQEIQDVVLRTSEETQQKINWTQLWAQKYPILATYQQQVPVVAYGEALGELLERLQRDYGYGKLDAFLVLKDILGNLWKGEP